jgi:hypothetical protein
VYKRQILPCRFARMQAAACRHSVGARKDMGKRQIGKSVRNFGGIFLLV